MEPLVRPARAADLAEVGRLTLAAYRHDGYIDAGDPYEPRLVDAAARAREAELLVAEGGGLLLGTVTYCPAGSPWREIGRDGEGEFRMLAVDPGARRQGAADALVRRCIERSREDGCHAVVLCSLSVQEAAHRLYARLGFVRLPDRDWSPGPGHRLLGFRLDLDS